MSMGTLINEGILDPGEKVLISDYMVGELSIQTFTMSVIVRKTGKNNRKTYEYLYPRMPRGY